MGPTPPVPVRSRGGRRLRSIQFPCRERRPRNDIPRSLQTSTHAAVTRTAIERTDPALRRFFPFAALAAVLLFSPSPARAQLEIGASGGAVFGWAQDVHVEER